ncbi:hypothetical protein [Flavobacterium sp. HBTb2-11-1]|uniref:hypothetical protein n=1 Tax=Flavobacterium sp. HBTb2-11-1 TaxID=2692212 RepID=UPI001368ADF4|nr:hypothetical protein [Flavobacterium sp. HBTb2-11-1]MXO04501.1 hypothetical protein [Flavobacterium sp. HBTb2-11-1]
MNTLGPVVVVDGSTANCLLFQKIFKKLEMRNTLLCFGSLREAGYRLSEVGMDPFLLLVNVMQFAQKIRMSDYLLFMELRCLCLFFSISSARCFVVDAYTGPKLTYTSSDWSEENFTEMILSALLHLEKESFKELLRRRIEDKN